MDRDEWWLSSDLDSFDGLSETDEQFDAFSLHDSVIDPVADRFNAEITAHQLWPVRRDDRRWRRPKRQLYPCYRTAWQRSLLADRSFAIKERQRIVHYVLKRDIADQLDDYVAEQFTDIPSVITWFTLGQMDSLDNQSKLAAETIRRMPRKENLASDLQTA